MRLSIAVPASILVLAAALALAQGPDIPGPAATQPTPTTSQPDQAAATQPSTQPSRLSKVVVTAELDQARAMIAPALGAVTYTMGQDQIRTVPQGSNATFQQVLVRAPGVVMDSFGQEHVRGEHGNLTYRVNGTLLPEGLNGFGQELDTHLIDSVTLIDGSLPAQFGFRTAGIVDVITKSGATLNGSEASVYGGSFGTLDSSFETGGTADKLDYFFTTSYRRNDLGIENPTSSSIAIHDHTDQERGFGYLSYNIDNSSRVSLLFNLSNADFQIPNIAGQAQQFNLAGVPPGNSADLNENQNEQQYYAVVSYQKSTKDLSLQASYFSRYGQIFFRPDVVGDLIFQGGADQVFNSFLTNGVQFDASYIVNDYHTLRFGLLTDYTAEKLITSTSVFPVDDIGAQTSDTPLNIADSSGNEAFSTGFYAQDEWRLSPSLTLNYGLRYDRFDANFDGEAQVSPRINLVWKIDKDTTTHAGYSRYFVPPPVQYLGPGVIQRFVGTSGAPLSLQDDPPKVERSDYFDVGISRQITKPWTVGLDGFYKNATNLIDLGQFGDAVILSPYNYAVATVYGVEVSSTYKQGGFSAYGNFAYLETSARNIVSQQFQFTPDDLTFIQANHIHLDHDSTFTASAGVSYNWKHNLVYVDSIFGSGLRAGADNTETEPAYYPVNIGYEHIFRLSDEKRTALKFRFDILNVFDQVYQLRSGTGLGVNAPQYGERRAFLAGLSFDF